MPFTGNRRGYYLVRRGRLSHITYSVTGKEGFRPGNGGQRGGSAVRGRLSGLWNALLDHYVPALLVLALAALTLGGVGSPESVGAVGALLCAVGCTQRPPRADLWIILPMGVYLAAGLASSWRIYGTVAEGYAAAHAVFPAMYLLTACLDEGDLRLLKRLSALWAAGVAAAGIVQFTARALTGVPSRLGGALNNPNALGVFLTVGWFALLACRPEPEEQGALPALLRHAELPILTALALTLSMGSFLAMAAGILVLLVRERRRSGWRQAFEAACRILARAAIGIGLGILMYFTARHTRIPWFCLFLLAWLLAMAAQWQVFERFLAAYRRAAAVIAGSGVLVAGAAVAIRPSAIATFAERLEMIRDGLSYLPDHLLLGLGPYQWRLWNLHGGGKYFNTWHIHNFLVHTAVELGLLAALALLAIILRHWRKTGAACAAAFVFHGMIDTGFFYLGVTALALISAGEPQKGGRQLSGTASRLMFAALFALFVYCALYGRFQGTA